MITLFGLMGAIATLWGGGIGVALFSFARSRRINVVELLGLGWLFGIGLISLLLWAGSAVLSGWALQLGVTALALTTFFGGCYAVRQNRAQFHFPWPSSWLQWAATTLLLLQIAAIFYGSAKHSLGWDGLLVWEIKARYAFLNDGTLPGSYLGDGERAFSHPDYPLGLPLSELWIYLCLGEPNQFWAKLIFPIFYGAGAILLAICGARLTNSRMLGLVLSLLLFFVPQVTIGTGGTLVGYADVPLALVYMATIGYLLCALRQKEQSAFLVYAGCLALLPWLKKEGTILWAVAALAGAVAMLMQRRGWRTLLLLLPGLLLIVSWKIYLHQSSAVGSLDFATVTLHTLGANLSRLLPICVNVFEEMRTTSNWGIFWILLPVAIVRLTARKWSAVTAVVLTAVLLPIGLYSFIYIFSAWPNYVDHVNASLPRLLVQVVPVAFLLIGLAIQSEPDRRATLA